MNVDEFPVGATLVQDAGEGDLCHYVIKNLPKKFDREVVKSNKDLSKFEICENGTTRPLTLADIERQRPRL